MTGYNAQHEGSVRNYANLLGISPALALNVMRMESRGDATAQPIGKNGKPLSSAHGLFQMLDPTWKEQGGTAANRNDPETQARLGVQYLTKSRDYLKKNLGRDVQDYEVYMGHLLGPHGAKTLLSADPNGKLSDTVSKFSKNPNAVILNNGMNADMTNAQAAQFWSQRYDKVAGGRPARIPETTALAPKPIPQTPVVQPTPQAQAVPQNVIEVAQASAAPVLPSSNGLAASLVNERQSIVDKKALQDAYLSGKEAAEEKVQDTSPINMDGLAKSLSYMKDYSEYATPTNIGKAKGNSRLKFN